MIEKPKRPKQPSIQERQPPRTLQELVNRYDLDNTKIYDFLDELVNQINDRENTVNSNITSLQNQIDDKNIITVGIANNVTISTAGYNSVSYDTVIKSIGNKLTLVNGKIVIGAGVHTILVNGQGSLYVKAGNGNAKNFYIYKNTSQYMANVNTFSRTSDSNYTRTYGSMLMPVAENDTISFSVYAGVNDIVLGALSRNYLTIETID